MSDGREDPDGESPGPTTGPGSYPVPVSGRFFVLVNPHAAGGETASLRRRLAAEFAGHDVPFDLFVAPDPGSAVRAVRAAARSGCRAVAAAGGDGTVAQALRGTAGTEIPVAILPFGTGNQLALNFDVPRSLEGSVRVAVDGRPESVDLGRADGEHFALCAGAGLDAEMVADATDALKSRLGSVAYLLSGLKHAITPKVADFRIVADGEEMAVRASMVLLANVGQVAAGPIPMEFRVGPGVSFRDGLVDVCVYAPRNVPEMAQVLWQVVRQEFGGSDRMLFRQARRVRVESDPPVATQIDGEPSGQTPLEVEMDPLAGRIMVPR